jgi:hypothetical protein
VETSEQQRRPTVGSLAHTLAAAQLDFDAIDVADMLWLAQFAATPAPAQPDPAPVEEPAADLPDRDPDPGPPPPSIETDGLPPPPDAGLNLYADTPAPDPTGEEVTEPAPSPPGTPFAVPAAPALRTRMDLARALRPLMRKVPSRTQFDLDEAATVTQIAETAVWLPVVRPRPERWLELDLVVESSKTTVIWEQAIAELNHLVEYQGAFRALRTWHLDGQEGQIRLFPRWRDGLQPNPSAPPSQRPHTPNELVDPTGQRLIWLVSDCTSALWRQGQIHPTLMAWSQAQSVAIVQLLPEPLWTRTALRDGHQVKLSALAPGLPNTRLEVEGLPSRLMQRGGKDLATVPIVTLDAPALKRWARVVAGAGDTRTPGRSFDLAFLRRQAARGRSTPPQGAQPLPTAQERVDLFRATASKTARQLANLMAATPVSLPVINLLREAFKADFAEEVRQSHVAEVLLSGLLRRCDTEADTLCRYEFWGDDAAQPEQRVRDILLGDTAIAQTIKVLDVLSAAICRQLGSPTKSFQALLAEAEAGAAPEELRAAALPFATVGLDVLRRLGGEYADLAEHYGSIRTGQQGEAERSASEFLLEDDTYEVAEFINFPPLEPFEFVDAQFEEEAETIFPQSLQQFEELLQPDTAATGVEDISDELIASQLHRYPFLYDTHLLVNKDSTQAQLEHFRGLRQQSEAQLGVKLARWARWQADKSFPNPTRLGDEELQAALHHYTGKVNGNRSQRDMAHMFAVYSRTVRSFRDFKEEFLEYLIAPLASKDYRYDNHAFTRTLRAFVRQTLSEFDDQPPKEYTIVSFCQKLVTFVVAEGRKNLIFRRFRALIEDAGHILTLGLLLRVVLFCPRVKPWLENRMAMLFKHHEQIRCGDAVWLIDTLEHTNVALITNFSKSYLFQT